MQQTVLLATVMVGLAVAGPQYSPGVPGPEIPVVVCQPNWDCVHSSICYDGVIDTSGGGAFDLRTGVFAPVECTQAEHVCCQLPKGTVDVPAVNLQCSPHEDCVQRDYCHDGVINTDGGGFIDLRIKKTDYRTCYNQEYSEDGICCRIPDGPPVVDSCPDIAICTDLSYCNANGEISPNVQGQIYGGSDCYTNPGLSWNVGVCCQPARPVVRTECPSTQVCTDSAHCDASGSYSDAPVAPGVYPGEACTLGFGVGVCCTPTVVLDTCPHGAQCAPQEYCGVDGHLVSSPLQAPYAIGATECYLNAQVGSLVTGVCCLPPLPVTTCEQGSVCTGKLYCDASGFVSPSALSAPGFDFGQDCYVGGTHDVGVCCTPFPPATCPQGTECAPRDYCSDQGHLVSSPHNGQFYRGQECSLGGGYSGGAPGVCCSPPLPEPTALCPKDSECVPQDFCFGEMLEEDIVSYSSFSQQKSWFACSVPSDIGYGVCCRNKRPEVANTCGVSHYANNDLKTRFYQTTLDKHEADFGEMPWQAIVFYSNYTFKCGASLISDTHLLTVAHCVDGLYPQDLRIRLGEWQVNAFDEPLPYSDVDVKAITIHPNWDKKKVWNNLAILELAYPVSLQYNINNICLPFGDVNFRAPKRCFVSGWGKSSFDGQYQHILKKVSLPLVEHAECQAYLRKTRLRKYFKLHESYRCAGGEEGIDACTGDGGGPLICLDDVTGAYFQVGITAWGIGCGSKDVPAAYTDVTKFSSWISSVTGLGGSGSVGSYGR